MRSMASIRRIDDILPIPGADAIECAVIGGWTVVIRKGEFTTSNLAVFCEIDSWIPNHLAPFLTKTKEPRIYNDVPGEKLRTIRLRGQLSQGLLLPLSVLLPHMEQGKTFVEGDDVSEVLNIQKYEAPVSAQLADIMRGSIRYRIRCRRHLAVHLPQDYCTRHS